MADSFAVDESLACTPERRFRVSESLPAAVVSAFADGECVGILFLCNEGLREVLPAPLSWLRALGARFMTELCQRRDAATIPDLADAAASELVSSAPPMQGGEYLEATLLKRLWAEMREAVATALLSQPLGFEGWIPDRAPHWRQVGRVTLHLAENKANASAPFAFLATYTVQLSSDGRLQHVPLGRALLEGQKSPGTLEALLKPVRAAAEASPLLAALLESKRLFQALSWTPQEAYPFLCEIPRLEQCGLVVKLPDWWKGRKAARPMVAVTLDTPVEGGVGMAALLQFSIGLTLGGVRLTPEEAAQIRAVPSGLVNLRGQWVEVDQQRLQQALEHWGKVQSAHQTGGVSFHEGMRWLSGFSHAGGADAGAADLDGGRSWSEVVAGKGLQAWLERMKAPAHTGDVPGLEATLRPYQREGVGWLDFVSRIGLGACLADDMGLGKTLQVIALLCLRKASASAGGPSLLVLPASLLGNWVAEFRRFAPHLRVKVMHSSFAPRENLSEMEHEPARAFAGVDAVLTSYTLLQRSETLQEVRWDLVVLDEAQAIKNPATAQARAVKKLHSHARIALTGTPVENRLGDLWSLFDFLNPGLLCGASTFSDITRAMGTAPGGYAPLRRLIAPYLLRRLKTDRRVIADLPEKIEMQTRCGMAKKQALLYARLVEQLKADLVNEEMDDNLRKGLVLAYLTKFKQVCNHPSHWSGDGRFLPEDSGKFAALGRIAAEVAERQERCLVFTQFREMTAPIAGFLSGIFGRSGVILHGGTPVGERQKLVDSFQRTDGPPFFVLSVKAGGTGLTLTAASHVVHFDRWWNPAVENQATDRAFRIGQKRNVLVHKFVCTGTIEEKVDALLRKKGELAEDILGGEAGAHRLLTQMSSEELLNFVRLDIESAEL